MTQSANASPFVRRVRAAGRALAFSCLTLGILAVAMEAGARLGGLGDFPLYDRGGPVGYVPRPGQSGKFLGRIDWEFNSESMNAPAWAPGAGPNLLLLGNSIVLGGNAFDQTVRLGPQLEAALGHKTAVWPAAAGSWHVLNEIGYLDSHPEAVKEFDALVWVVTSGDFGARAEWRSQYIHPTRYPPVLIYYDFRKYVLGGAAGSPDPGPRDLALPDFGAALAAIARRGRPAVTVVLYPTKEETENDGASAEWQQIAGEVKATALAHGAKFVTPLGRPDWTVSLYLDGIHPNVAGIGVLSRFLAAY